MARDVPDVAFLGICQRAIQTESRGFNVYGMAGLSDVFIAPILPLNLQGIQCVLAIYDPFHFEPATLRILQPSGDELCHADIRIETGHSNQATGGTSGNAPIGLFTQSQYAVWTPIVMRLDCPIIVTAMAQHPVVLCRSGVEQSVGCLNVGLAEVPPLTEDRIAAIRSDPDAVKYARYDIRCSRCDTTYSVYTGIDRNTSMEKEGAVWYKNAEDIYRCTCGEASLDLRIIRQNLHALLDHRVTSDSKISFVSLYERTATRSIHTMFRELLGTDPCEEAVQEFIEDHPILLHQFSPTRVFFKPAILSKYKADFVILTAAKELALVEIERPSTKLMKKDGGVSSELQHARDQVHDWLHEVDEHRQAVLSCLGIEPQEVATVRGIVIAGRGTSYNRAHLQRLKKRVDSDRVLVMTYDDLLGSLSSLIRAIDNI